jgi:hypothetical protein
MNIALSPFENRNTDNSLTDCNLGASGACLSATVYELMRLLFYQDPQDGGPALSLQLSDDGVPPLPYPVMIEAEMGLTAKT